jgi:hypothetical protein
MSQMSTTAVFQCKYCFRPVYVSELRTTTPDPNGELLNEFMRNLDKIAHVCPECRKKLKYYESQGRADEFYSGAFVTIDLDRLERLVKKNG